MFLNLIYITACFIYTLIVLRMSVPVHLNVDEELYLAMAKSFHYEHNFQKEFEYLNYNCVLYSMLISLAYFWFTPEHIMTIVRFINVIVMCSAIFPAYLLAYDILHSRKKALIVGAFVLLIPDMVDSVYAMQEILCFPLLMWYFWCVYRDLKRQGGADEWLLYNGCDSFGFTFFYQNKYDGDSTWVFIVQLLEAGAKAYKKDILYFCTWSCAGISGNAGDCFPEWLAYGSQSLCETDPGIVSYYREDFYCIMQRAGILYHFFPAEYRNPSCNSPIYEPEIL